MWDVPLLRLFSQHASYLEQQLLKIVITNWLQSYAIMTLCNDFYSLKLDFI